MIISRMSTTAKECTPNVSNDENANNERKVMNENKWIKPKKCMQINYFYKKCENKAEWEMNNNKYIELVNNDEIEEGKVEEIKVNNNKQKMIKEKFGENNKNQVKTINKQRYKSKLNEGMDYEEELNKSKKLEIEFRKDNELFCAEYNKLNMKSFHAETRHDVLVEQFREEF